MFDPATHARYLTDLETSVRNARDAHEGHAAPRIPRTLVVIAVFVVAGASLAGNFI